MRDKHADDAIKKVQADLLAQMDALASNPDDAEKFMFSMATALFPEGGELHHTTWPDASMRSAGGGTASDDPEERLRSAEKRYRTLVEQIPAVTFMAVLGEGLNEVYVSPHIETMLGYSQDEWLADPFLWYYRLHPDDRVLWNSEFARGCQTGGPFKAECRFLARDGHIVWVHGEARLVRDDHGRPLFLQGIAFDITETKRAQEVLLNEAVRTARAEEELAIARRVQTSILPRDLDVSGLEIAAAMRPASDVGGDYYDVLPAPGGCWLSIGDVSGHGLDAGLVMLMVQSAMAAITGANATSPPSEVVCRLNDVLYENIRRRLGVDDHVTLSLLRYTTDGKFVVAGAHEDIIICRKSQPRAEHFRPPGTWIGARRDVREFMVDSTLQLEDGDLLVLYTDGITEAMNAQEEQFDIGRLTEVVEKHRNQSCASIRDAIVDAVRGWMHDQRDDITLMVVRYNGAGK